MGFLVQQTNLMIELQIWLRGMYIKKKRKMMGFDLITECSHMCVFTGERYESISHLGVKMALFTHCFDIVNKCDDAKL